MEAWLPKDKLEKAKTWGKTLESRTISRSNLRSLLEFLSFALSWSFPDGRAFLRRLFDALAEKRRYYAVDPEMRADLLWWDEFLPNWNGMSFAAQRFKKTGTALDRRFGKLGHGRFLAFRRSTNTCR